MYLIGPLRELIEACWHQQRFERPSTVKILETLSFARRSMVASDTLPSASKVSTLNCWHGNIPFPDFKEYLFVQPGSIIFRGPEQPMYVCDNHAIRSVEPSGAVTTFAGTNEAGYNDSGKTTALFNEPACIAYYAAKDEYYVADSGNNVVRVIEPKGFVRTFAGTLASGMEDGDRDKASFWLPYGIAVNQKNGDIFVSDQMGHSIRRITQLGKVTTIAGVPGTSGFLDGPLRDAGHPEGNALLNGPAGIAYDESELCLYIADAFNHAIRKLDFKQNTLTTVAGGGEHGEDGYADQEGRAARFSFPLGVALLSSDSLLVADSDNHRIRKIDLRGGVVSTVAGSGEQGDTDGITPLTSTFNQPKAICVHPITPTATSCFIADSANGTVRKLVLI